MKKVRKPHFFVNLPSTKCWVLSVVCLAFGASLSANTDLVFTGKAFAIDSDRLLYVEYHHIKRDSFGTYLTSEVNYFDAEGLPLATKTLNFSPNPTMPSLNYIDKRIDAKMEVTFSNTEMTPNVRILKERDGKRKLALVKTANKLTSVVDAGFDQYVMSHWQDLIDGRQVDMNFLALTRSEYIGFQLKKIKQEKNIIVLSLRPSNFLIRLLLEPIYLSYHVQSKRLLRFEGLTNLEMVTQGKGLEENYVARIEYSYP